MRRPLPPVATVVSFIDRINRGDVDGLVALITDDHTQSTLGAPPVAGREANRKAWNGYLTFFPRYVVLPQRVAARGSRVAILGSTRGSHLGLPDEEEELIPVLWLAEVRDGKLASWAILDDSPRARAELGLA